MVKRRALRAWFVDVLLCTVVISWLLLAGRAFAAGTGVPGTGALAPAQLSGKITLELSGVCQPSVIEEVALSASFDGRLHVPLGQGTFCDMTAAVRPHPLAGVVYGYGALRVRSRPGSGLGFDLALRRGSSSEAEEPGDESAECVLSSLATSLSWESRRNSLFCEGSYASTERAYPYRPMRDRREREVSGLVRSTVASHLSLRADVSLIDNEYRVAEHNSSTTRLSSVEGSYRWGKQLTTGVRVEGKDKRYPHSVAKTYRQVVWELAVSCDPAPRLSLDSLVSFVDRSFPFDPAKNRYDREITLSASTRQRGTGVVTLEGTVFERKAPASSEKEYRMSSLEARYAFSPAGELAVSVACTLSKKRYSDPAAYAGSYDEVQLSCKLSHQLARDLEIVGETEVKRREYPLKESSSTHRVKSSVVVVYRL